MKIVIDTNQLVKEKCSTQKALLLLALYYESFNSAVITQAVLDGYLTFKAQESTMECDKFVLTQEGAEKVESIMANSEIVETTNNGDRYVALAIKLREIYPTGRKPGTAYQWRDSVNIISTRLKSLVKKYGETFTDEQAIKATERYVNSFNGNYTYMQLLKYFIMKNNISDRADDTSQLLAYIENDGQEDINNSDIGELL